MKLSATDITREFTLRHWVNPGGSDGHYETVSVLVLVTLDEHRIRHLAFNAMTNKRHRAKRGPVTVKFLASQPAQPERFAK